MANTFVVKFANCVHANNKTVFYLNNANNSGQTLNVTRVWWNALSTGTVTGVLGLYILERYYINASAPTSGNTSTGAVDFIKYNSAATAQTAQITAANGNTAISGTFVSDGIFRRVLRDTDEPGAAALSMPEMYTIPVGALLWDSTGDTNIEPIVIPGGNGASQAFGLRLYSPVATTAAYGAVSGDAFVEFYIS